MNSDLNAEHYATHSTIQYRSTHELIDSIKLAGNEHILDVGCGDGKISTELSRRVPEGKVIGIDSSSSMIEFAKKTYSGAAYSTLTFDLMLVEEMWFEQKFDLMICMNALHWVKDPSQAIQKMSRYLAPKGQLLLLTYPQESAYWQFLNKTLEQPQWEHYGACQTVLPSDQYKQMLLKSGFELQDFRLEAQSAEYDDKEALIDYIKGWLPSFVPLSLSDREAFLQDAANEAYQCYPSIQSRLTIPYTKMSVVAKKS